MWTVQVNGAWQSVSTDQVREMIQRGVLGAETVVRHDTWKEPGRLGQVQAFAGLFPKVEVLSDEDVRLSLSGERASQQYARATVPGRPVADSWLPASMQPMMRPVGLAVGAVAGLLCIVAGLRMLSWSSHAVAEKDGMVDLFSVLKTGLGLCFCGNGLAIWAIVLLGFGGARPKA